MADKLVSHDTSPLLLQTFELAGAQVTGDLRSDRGIIVERVPRLVCTEGRLYTFKFLSDGELRTFEYNFSFGVSLREGQLPLTAAPARILIAGRHSNGSHLEISGPGWIGYHDEVNLAGRFDSPPAITTWDSVPEASGRKAGDPKAGCTIIDFPTRSQRRLRSRPR